MVTNELPAPPYEPDTAANGYGFDLDVVRMQNSDSWLICPPELRPWMMMTWVMSWTQRPCGSLPADDEILAARIGCTLDFLQVHRRYILRGWERHADGRLYHHVVTEIVLKMIASRDKWRLKKRGQRQAKPDDTNPVPGDTPETPRGVPGASPPSSSSSSSSYVKEGKPSWSESRDAGSDRAPSCPHHDIIRLYHQLLPELPGIIVSRWFGSEGESHLRTRWREDPRHQSLAFWERFFQTIRTNPHWMGDNERGWRADLRWVLKRANFDKVLQRMVANSEHPREAAHG